MVVRIIDVSNIVRGLYNFFFSYGAPSNLSYLWNFGIYSLLCLVIQIITGILLAMHYVPEHTLAFLSIEYIMRNVFMGWLIRYIHSNGASMFFIVVYIHTFRGLYFSSYMAPREVLWIIGVIILLLMIITAFLGYVLPWGQMSFWAATVITNLVSAVPLMGSSLLVWLWGGYSVDNATLNRFFSLHYLMPFVILGLVIVHLIYLHDNGSSNPIGVDFKHVDDHLSMYPYFIYKDLFGVIVFFIFFSLFLFFAPNLLGHTDNYIYANPMVTPTHIVPEWYFLPFYAILRSIPDKLLGVLTMLFALVVLAILPYWMKIRVKSMNFTPIVRVGFWFFVAICIGLGWIGSMPASYPYVGIGEFLTYSYFFYWIIIVPTLYRVEDFIWDVRFQ